MEIDFRELSDNYNSPEIIDIRNQADFYGTNCDTDIDVLLITEY